MPNDQPRPPQRAWRDAASSPSSPSKGGPAWKGQVDAAPAPARQPMSKKAKLTFGVGLLGALAGLIVVIILLFKPYKGLDLVVLSAGYETNLAVPHNVPGRNNSAKLVAWGRARAAHPEVEVEAHEADLTSGLDTLDKAIENARRPTFVLFLAGHGAADQDGPYLIPQDTDPTDPRYRDPTRPPHEILGRRVYLSKVLEKLKNGLPAKTKKLLILDATQVAAHWPLGLFHNDFARKLKDLKPEIDRIGNLVVLSASDEDQRSWVSEEWGQSIFAHHVLEGLRGAAPSSKGRITAYDLYQYVQEKVKHWSRQNRGAPQTPVLLGDEAVARDLVLVPVEGTFQARDPRDLKEFKVPEQLTAEWAEAHKLAASPLSPAVYTPHWWRLYTESLLRYEQLLRAGDKDSAKKMHKGLAALRDRVGNAQALRRLKRDSALGTLAMPAALGWAALAGDDAKKAQALQKDLDKGDEQAVKEKRGQWLTAEKDMWQKRLLRVRLNGMLVRQAAANPQRDLKQVYTLLTAPDDATDPRPAEAQYLVLLERDLLPQRPWPTVAEALKVRLLAEEAAMGLQPGETGGGRLPPYSEQLLPWIRATVEKGDGGLRPKDRGRRPGQDLLVSAEKDWPKAAEQLTEARGHYTQAQAIALTVRQALQQRDEALVVLPYYAQWVARQRVGETAKAGDFDTQVEAQLKLWGSVQELDRLLRTPDPDAVAKLPNSTKAVQAGMKLVKDDLTARYRKDYPLTQENWHELDNLLRIPFLPPGVSAAKRMELLDRLRKISEKLNLETAKAGGERDPGAQQASALNRERGRAQGRLALAALGEDAYKSQKGAIDYEEAEKLIRFDPDWQKGLARGGNEVARRWNQIPTWITDQLALSHKEALDKAGERTRAAAALARRLPGATAEWLRPADPLDEQRRLQLYDLFCWQAERTDRDFLAGEGDQPYYRTAGVVYASDARAELAGLEGVPPKQLPMRLERATRLKADLEDDNRKLMVAWSLDGRKFDPAQGSEVPLTDEKKLSLWYGVRSSAPVPPGYPVLWRDLTGTKAFLQPFKDPPRQVQEEFGADLTKAALPFPLLRQERETAPRVQEEAKQVVHGLYRGHHLVGETKITHYALPDAGASLPATPEKGKLAVQATPEVYKKYGAGNGAVVLILDCSGSMKARQPDGRTRFDHARDALQRVLAEIPPNTQVSVWVFSHRVDVNNPNRRFDQGGGTNPEEYIQPLYFAKKWDRKMLDQVGPRIDALDFYNETPIVRAMMEARKDFKDQHGFKTMVVLTDGMDNRFDKDLVLNPGGRLTIPQFLASDKGFGKSDIALRIVGFQLPPNEQPIAEQQFKEPLEKLPKKGKFYLVQNTALLIKKLNESVKQRLSFTLEDLSGQVVDKVRGGKDVSRMEDKDDSRWVPLDPGIYEVVIDAQKEMRQKVRIRRGDRLRLNLYEKGDSLVLQRDLLQKSFPGMPYAYGKAKDWLVTVVQNQKLAEDDVLQMTVTAENLSKREFGREGTLGHVRPSLILFRMRPQDNRKGPPLSLRYYALADYTAPAWGLDIKPWVRDKKPVLEAFWSEDPPPVAGVLRRGQHFGDDLQAVLGSALDVQLTNRERGKVQLLSIGIEKHPVDTVDTARTGKQEEVACLVVRMTFPPGKPLMAQLPWEEFSGGQEHRFYTAAGKYTGLFWPRKGDMTLQQAQKQVQTLNLISLEGFREAAEALGQYTTIELSKPNNMPRPRPPQ